MRRIVYVFIVLLAFTGIGCPPAAKDDPSKPDHLNVLDKTKPRVEVPEDVKRRVEAALDQVHARDLSTDHGFWTVFHGILGTGLEKTTLRNPETREKFNAIDFICKGGVIKGLKFEQTKDGLDVQTVDAKKIEGQQYFAQGHQDQFIAEMTQWGMPKTRKFVVAGRDFTFEDFVRHSKMRASVKETQELSWAIVIIAQFYGTDHEWTNRAGERLTFDDVVRYELDQPIVENAACGGTHRLFGLTWAYHLHLKRGGRNEGVWLDVEKKLDEFKKLAKKLQNPDGTFSTDYFKGPGKADEVALRISTTGHIVEWLALAMTDDELREPWMELAVSTLAALILDMGHASIDGGALYHAAHGLYLYHERVFGTPPAFLPLRPTK